MKTDEVLDQAVAETKRSSLTAFMQFELSAPLARKVQAYVAKVKRHYKITATQARAAVLLAAIQSAPGYIHDRTVETQVKLPEGAKRSHYIREGDIIREVHNDGRRLSLAFGQGADLIYAETGKMTLDITLRQSVEIMADMERRYREFPNGTNDPAATEKWLRIVASEIRSDA